MKRGLDREQLKDVVWQAIKKSGCKVLHWQEEEEKTFPPLKNSTIISVLYNKRANISEHMRNAIINGAYANNFFKE